MLGFLRIVTRWMLVPRISETCIIYIKKMTLCALNVYQCHELYLLEESCAISCQLRSRHPNLCRKLSQNKANAANAVLHTRGNHQTRASFPNDKQSSWQGSQSVNTCNISSSFSPSTDICARAFPRSTYAADWVRGAFPKMFIIAGGHHFCVRT
jgi:hypothetical protein